MEDESRDPRAPAGPDDDGSSLSPTTTAAAAATDHAAAADSHANDSTATTTPTAFPPPTSPTHGNGDRKASVVPADIATSPRGSTAGFVAPSSYLRPLAVTREREEHHRGEGRRGGAGEGKMVHPLDREQMEGLVSESHRLLMDMLGTS